MAEQLICNQQVDGSTPFTSSSSCNIFNGSVPERPKGADCKSVVTDFAGPNPATPTTKKGHQYGVLFLWWECRLRTDFRFSNENLVRSFAKRVGVCLQAKMRAKASALPRIQPFLFVVGVASSDSLFVFKENKNLVRSLLQSRCQLASIRLGAKLTLVRIQPLRLTYSWNWENKKTKGSSPWFCFFILRNQLHDFRGLG